MSKTRIRKKEILLRGKWLLNTNLKNAVAQVLQWLVLTVTKSSFKGRKANI